MSGDSWEEEPSFSAVNEIEGHSLSTLTDLDFSCNNFTINASKLNCWKISNKEGVSKCRNSCTCNCNVVSSKHLTNQHYDDFVKPRLNVHHDLEYSLSQFFTDNKPKGVDSVKEFVAGRIANIIDKVRKSKSSSCSDLVNLSSSPCLMKNKADDNDLNNWKIDYDDNLCCDQLDNPTYIVQVDKLNVGLSGRGQHFSGSIEVLNCFHANETKVQSKGNDTYEVDEPLFFNTSHPMKKSFSCSGLPHVKSDGIGKHDSLLDVELNLDDSVPSEDEKDEYGLPIKRFIFNTPSTSNMDPELMQTIEKYNILRASFCEPSDEINDENQPEPTQAKNPDTVKEPLLPDFHGGETSPRNIENPKSKGPMKALVPLQNMTKNMAEMVISPFIKNKGKPTASTTNNISHIFSEIFDEKAIPMAASTPSDGRKSRKDLFDNSSRAAATASKSAATPSKSAATPSKSVNPNNKQVNNKPSDNPAIITTTNSSVKCPVKKITASNLTKTLSKPSKTTNLVKPQIRSSLGRRRSSSASALPDPSIRAPLTTKLLPNIQDVSSTAGILMDSRYNKTIASPINSMSNSITTTTLTKVSCTSNAKDTTMNKLSTKTGGSEKCWVALTRSVCANKMSSRPNAAISNLKRPSMLSKFRVPGLGKENKK